MDERTLSTTHPWTGKRIRVRVDEVERSDGHRTIREIVEHPGAVAILAWDGERLAMVRQWRHATGQVLLEIPAGTLEPDEPPAETARRELDEGSASPPARGRKARSSIPLPDSATS
jgi:ADP-ribose pyrophosphatase